MKADDVMRASLGRLPETLRDWLRHNAKFKPSWDPDRLRAILKSRHVPCFEALSAWEGSLHALRPDRVDETAYLFDLYGVCLDSSMMVSRDYWSTDLVIRSPEAGADLVPLGKLPGGDRIYLDDESRVFRMRRSAVSLYAEHPSIYLARIAIHGLAMGEGLLQIVVNGRASAGPLAARLGLAREDSACDHLQSFWRGDASLVYDGELDEPTADVTHVFASRSGALALLEACRTLGLGGALARSFGMAQIEEPEEADERCPRRSWIPYTPLFGRGSGWVALCEEPPMSTVEQVVNVDGFRVSEEVWPGGRVVERTRVAILPGLSPQGTERLRRLDFRRDPRRTAPPDQIEEVLRRHGLPSFACVQTIECLLGGLRRPFRDGAAWLSFGVFQLLTDNIESIDHASWAAESAAIECGSDWPQVRYQGRELVPVGTDVEATLYADESGIVLAHHWMTDEVEEIGHAPLPLLERLLLRIDLGERLQSGSARELCAPGAIGATLAQELGLALVSYASDGFETCWENDEGRAWLVEHRASKVVRLVTTEDALLEAARQRVSRLGV